MSDADVIVIGAGTGGYPAAIRARQLGLRAIVVERAELGGTCLNWGCIPTKALLRSAEVLETCERAADYGVTVSGDVTPDFSRMIARSRAISAKISKGVSFLFRKNEIDLRVGTAKLLGAGKVSVTGPDGAQQTLSAPAIVVATGARAKALPGVDHDGEVVIAYREAMTLPVQPRSMLVIGAGAIGVEFASFYRSLGTEVTIVEFLDRLVPNEDEDVSAELARAFKKRGIRSFTSHKVTGAAVRDGAAEVTFESRDGGAGQSITVDSVLVAVGITANTENLGLEAIGVKLDGGFVAVDDDLQTSVAGVYAVGDVCNKGPALAHVSTAQAIQLAEHIAGHTPVKVDYDCIPACTYCEPEIASVGLTEAAAKERGIDMKIGKFPLFPLGKNMAYGGYPGFVKLIFDAADHSLVGAHMIGPAVTDLVAVPTLAKSTEVNAESLIHTVHAHPTFAEALKEAAENALGIAIHI